MGQLILKKKIYVYSLADQLYVSEQTAYKDIKKLLSTVKEKYNFNHISFTNRVVSLNAPELELRILLYRIIKDEIYLKTSFINSNLYQLTEHYYSLKQLQFIKEKIYEFCQINNISLNDRVIFVITWMTIVTSERVKHNEKLEKHVELFHENKELVCLVSQLLEKLNIDYLISDKNLLQNYIETLGFESESKGYKLEEEIESIIIEFFDQVKRKYSYDFTSVPDLCDKFKKHLQLTIKRLMINYQLVNPLVDDCKLKHPFAFEISMLIVPILYDRYGLYLNEDEVSFLTLYVLMMLNVKNVKLKVLLVNSMQKSFSNFIENWIKSEYAEYINIVGVCPVYRIQEELLASNVDLIISDTVLDVDEGVPYIVINHLPGSLEKEEINNFIFRKTGFFSINKIFSQMFSEKNILIVDENLDFLDLMKKSANILKAQECIDDEEQFLDNLISRKWCIRRIYVMDVLCHIHLLIIRKKVQYVLLFKKEKLKLIILCLK